MGLKCSPAYVFSDICSHGVDDTGKIRIYFRSTRFVRIPLNEIELEILQPFLKQEVKPEWIILNTIPVLPPDLRPILVLDSQQVAVSDLNTLYQKLS